MSILGSMTNYIGKSLLMMSIILDPALKSWKGKGKPMSRSICYGILISPLKSIFFLRKCRKENF